MDWRPIFNENNSFIPELPVHIREGPVGSHGLICPDAHGPCAPSATQETVPTIMSKV